MTHSRAIELDRACLLIAAEEYPELPIESYLVELDVLAGRVASRVARDAGPFETLAHMRSVLADEEGFTGNTEHYDDPRNSFLNDVLDRRTGLPITLSTIYLEVARRIGFDLKGVGFPGHFVVKFEAGGERILVDPYNGGKLLEASDLAARLDASYAGRVEYSPSMLRAVSSRELLYRVLTNLKVYYLRARDDARALAAVERMLLVDPEKHREHRDRGVLLSRLDRPMEAVSALARYRRLAPESSDGDRVDEMMDSLRLEIGMDN